MPSSPSTDLTTFPNPATARDYTVRMTLPEFTCLCPLTGQPDFATLELEYVPDALCVELKSLKLYIWAFRDRGAFHEAVTNEIAEHISKEIEIQRPRRNLYLGGGRDAASRLAAGPRRDPAVGPREPPNRCFAAALYSHGRAGIIPRPSPRQLLLRSD